MGSDVFNVLDLFGPKADMRRFVLEAKDETGRVLTPEKFVPFPPLEEWANALLDLSSKHPDLVRSFEVLNLNNAKQIVKKFMKKGYEFEYLPTTLDANSWRDFFHRNIGKPWVHENWGAFVGDVKKRENPIQICCLDNRDERSARYTFYSRNYNPPKPLIQKMSQQFLSIEFKLCYFDELSSLHGIYHKRGSIEKEKVGPYYGPRFW